MHPPDPCPLDSLTAGTAASVLRVEGDDDLARRLVDLGFWPGTPVFVGRRAPMGDPTEYRLRGYRLALRRNEAARVIVTTGA
jgi:Fe2+ transport system protein FeoA